jgi:sugar phosphate permease
MLGLFFSLGKIVGVLIATFLELIFDAATFSWSWRILLSLTAFFSIIQAVLIFFFGSDTPTEMIEKGNEP